MLSASFAIFHGLVWYTVFTFRLARVTNLEFLMIIPQVFVWIALAAWAVTAAGLVRALLRSFGEIR